MNNNAAVVQAIQRRYGTADWERWQVQRWCWWDYNRYTNAGITSMSFFVNPMGTQDPVSGLSKTTEQTNMEQSRAFGQVYAVITNIRSHIHVLPKNRQAAGISGDADVIFTTYSNVMKDFPQLCNQGVFVWNILQKNQSEIAQPFLNLGAGMGVQINQHASTFAAEAIAESVWWQQSLRMGDLRYWTPFTVVEPNQTFDMKIEFPNGASPALTQVNSTDVRVDIGLILDGYIIRPAQ